MSTVRCVVADGVATVTIDRPDAMNALDTDTKIALRSTMAEVAEDDAVRAVVITGSGRAFCVGQDLREHASNLKDLPTEQVWATVPQHYSPIAHLLATMPKPTIAAVNGIAAGAGASLAFASDLRVVADTAGFNLAFTAIGLSCDTGTSWTLQRLVGRAKTLEILLLPETIAADAALRLGLATQVVPAAELLDAAQSLAARLAQGATQAYAAVKEAVTYAGAHDLADALEREATLMARTGATDDHRDAVTSFLAKEPPVFRNR